MESDESIGVLLWRFRFLPHLPLKKPDERFERAEALARPAMRILENEAPRFWVLIITFLFFPEAHEVSLIVGFSEPIQASSFNSLFVEDATCS